MAVAVDDTVNLRWQRRRREKTWRKINRKKGDGSAGGGRSNSIKDATAEGGGLEKVGVGFGIWQ